jgi:hypothetical protein
VLAKVEKCLRLILGTATQEDASFGREIIPTFRVYSDYEAETMEQAQKMFEEHYARNGLKIFDIKQADKDVNEEALIGPLGYDPDEP